MKFEISPSPKP